MIPVYKPYLTKESLKYAHEAIDSTWISSRGEYIGKCQDRMKEMLGVKHLILVANGTVATHMVALGLMKKFPHINKIIGPSCSYIAAINSFLYDNRFSIELVDSDIDTWNFDINQAIEKADDKSAILAVHNLGNIINVPELSKQSGRIIVEDNCEGFPGKYGTSFAGTKSLVSSFSFFGNKTLTSGEGGAVTTDDDEIFSHLNCVYSQGQSNRSPRFLHDEIGYNYRMTNIQAAILFGQLDIFNEIVNRKQELFDFYRESLKNFVILQKNETNTTHSNWMFAVRFENQRSYKDASLFFDNEGIETRPMFYPISDHPFIKNNQRVKIHLEDSSRKLHNSCIMIPSFPEITIDERKKIVEAVKKYADLIAK